MNATAATLEDGIHYDDTIGEYIVVVRQQIVNYATHWATAAWQFKEANRVQREHEQRCPIERMTQ